MTEAVQSGAQQQPDAIPALLEALRAEGAQQFDPVRFHYIEALANRAATHQGGVRQVLDAKLQAAAAALRQRRVQHQGQVETSPAPILSNEAGARPETLTDLVRLMAQHAPLQKLDTNLHDGTSVPVRTELKSVSYFRNTWSRLSAEKQVAQALEQAPKNAGPINSHVVALRSLALMRDTSPDYLSRFLSYVDTLLCLDPAERAVAPAPARAPRVAAKPKPQPKPKR